MGEEQCCFVSASGLLASGRPIELEWKAWCAESKCTWDVCRILDSIRMTTKEEPNWRWLRKRLGAFEHIWRLAGISRVNALRPSRHQQELAALSVGAAARDFGDGSHHDVPTVTTPALLCMLVGMGVVLRDADSKDKATTALRLVLERGVPAAADVSSFAEVSARVKACCPQQLAGQACAHLQGALDRFSMNGTCQHKIYVYLISLHSSSTWCAACAAQFQWSVERAAALIDTNVDSWAYTTDPLAARSVTAKSRSSKKRRVDEDFKRAVCQKVVVGGRSGSANEFLRSSNEFMGLKAKAWIEKGLLECQAATWFAANGLESLSASMDAARFGNPAEDTEIFCVVGQTGQREFGAILPPQV